MNPSTTNVLIYGDERLRAKCAEVVNFYGDSMNKLIELMQEVRMSHDGAGLAAPQIGVSVRVVVLHPQVAGRTCMEVLINPRITWASENKGSDIEGCLSVPGFKEFVARSTEIDFEYQDKTGNRHDAHATGFVARCIQHEIEHLDGILYVDHLNRDRQKKIEKSMRKLREEAA